MPDASLGLLLARKFVSMYRLWAIASLLRPVLLYRESATMLAIRKGATIGNGIIMQIMGSCRSIVDVL